MLVGVNTGAKRMGVSYVELEPNMKSTAGIHSHENRESTYIVLQGTGVLHLSGTEHQVKPKTVIFIPPSEKHGMVSTGNEVLKMVISWADLDPTT